MRLILQIVVLLALSLNFSCKSDEERFWDAVVINENSGSFAFVFSSGTIPFAGDYAADIVNRINNEQISGIKSTDVGIISLHPSELDLLWNPLAENILFNFDDNGNNTFENYPAFVNNWEMFNFDTTAFYQSIRNKSNSSAPLNVGTLIKARNGVLTFYVKIKYKETFSKNHSVAIYIYEKSKIAEQETTNGLVTNFTHRNLLYAAVNNELYGEKITGTHTTDDDGRHEYTHNVENYDLKNLGFITVVYELNSNDQPVGVINISKN